jgi:hypothetical protein
MSAVSISRMVAASKGFSPYGVWGMIDDFYIEAECCLSCGVPESVAPELFGMGEHACFLRRQPVSHPETDKMLRAMRQSEVDCIRYRGSDHALLKRLGEADLAYLADDERVHEFSALRRDRVTFSLPVSRQDTPAVVADMFRDFLGRNDRYTVRRAVLRRRVSFSWYERNYNSVVFGTRPNGEPVAVLRPGSAPALQGLAETVDEWLRNVYGADDIAWHTREGLAAGKIGYRLPY